jgi:hypothetical protein
MKTLERESKKDNYLFELWKFQRAGRIYYELDVTDTETEKKQKLIVQSHGMLATLDFLHDWDVQGSV